jgi:uncharacterized membrane protein
MAQLIIAAAVFVLMHLLVSGTRLRNAITGIVGEGPYMGLFSLASIAALVWMGFAYAHARGGPGDTIWWAATPATRLIALVLVAIGFLLLVPGLATRNPTSVRQEGVLADPDAAARGMLRITRHPFLWGVAFWAAAHLLVNGDAASLVLFASLLLLALLGPPSIDAKRARALGEKWAPFRARTSSVPFAAILAGRQKLELGEIGWWRILLAVVVFAAVLWAHPLLFGASPLG